MLMKKLYIVILVFMPAYLMAQFNPQQSLYMYNPLPVNPAATGKDKALNVTMSHRAMWQGLEGAPKTDYISIHSPLKKESIALGLQVFKDKIGVSSRSGISASASYRLKMRTGKLSFGISVGMVSTDNRWSQVVTTEEADRVFSSGDMTYWLPMASAGIYYETKKAFAGISIPQFLSETYAGGNRYKADSQLDNYSYQLMAGRKFTMAPKMYVQPSTLMKYHAKSGLQTDVSVAAGYENIAELGVTLRPKDALVFFMRAQLNTQLKLGYSYDHLTSTLAKYGKGTHEMILFYTFIYKSNAPNTRFF